MKSYEEKKEDLLKRMEDYAKEGLTVAFSGGVDSCLVLQMACEAAVKRGGAHPVYAVTGSSELLPKQELEVAEQTAVEMGAIWKNLEVKELQEAGIRQNPRNRCYLCKRHLFHKILEFSESLGVKTVLEGTNEEDLHLYRPGIQALRELGVKSPLAEAGITKAEVRKMAAECGISTADRPSTPCLATRFPYGMELVPEALKRVEKGEHFLKSLGFRNVRIRVYEPLVRIEVGVEELSRLLEKRQEIVAFLKELGYQHVTLDLEGFRSGSMDL